mgnify:FL=1
MNPFELFKNMDKIKSQAEEMKAKVATIKCSGYAYGNMIEAVANGNMEIESLKIDPSLVMEQNKAMLEVLVASAVNTALKNVKDRISQEAGQALSQYGI